MQFGQKTVGSQSAIKQLYRQYSATFKKNDFDKNIFMTQSSNLPFDKFYSAFNSTGNIKNLGLDQLKNSEAKSIIEKLMQTKEFAHKNKQEDLLLLNQLQTIGGVDCKDVMSLGKTEEKIFSEVVNLLTDIGDIKEEARRQKEQLSKLRIQLRSEGIQLPELEQRSEEPKLKRYTSKQLEQILQENQRLETHIDSITKQLAGGNQPKDNEPHIDSLINHNTSLKKQLFSLKSDIVGAGEVDDQDLTQLEFKIQELRQSIYVLQQKRLGKLTDQDQQLRLLKDQNQQLRLKTIQILTVQPQPNHHKKKNHIISILEQEETEKQRYLAQMQELKLRYERVLEQNSRLKEEGGQIRDPEYGGPLQVESKVSPFQQSYLEYNSVPSTGKENYLQNYDPSKRQNPNHPVDKSLYQKQSPWNRNQYQAEYQKSSSPWSGRPLNTVTPRY